MAWGFSSGPVINQNHKTSASSWVLASITAVAGNVLVICLSTDDIAAADGNTNTHTTITDDLSNTYVKAYEWTNKNTGSANGCCTSIWHSKTATGGAAVLTVNFSAAVTAKAIMADYFTITAGNV